MKRNSKNRLAFIASQDLELTKHMCVIKYWLKYETEIDLYVERHGSAHALKVYKENYLFLRNYLLQIKTLPLSFCKVDRCGIPKPLWLLRPLIKGNLKEQRLALTIARTYEKIRLPIEINTEPLERQTFNTYAASEVNLKFRSWMNIFFKRYPWYKGTLQPQSGLDIRLMNTRAKGPNGPAVATSHLDAKAVLSSPVLHKSVTEMNKNLNQEWITNMLNLHGSFERNNIEYHTGRLGFSSEPGGKTRMFAIGDYWSQLSLRIIQKSLYNTLKTISTDCTKDHEAGFKTLLQKSKGHPTYCFDLTSATDLAPAKMQMHRMEHLGGKGLSESWISVMTNRDFYIPAEKRNVRWKTGQPLGLLSSFPSFALWHHDIVQYANFIAYGKYKFFKKYILLGDDIVIWDTKVADAYLGILKELDQEVNLSKSILGTKDMSQIEFTKRLALKGKEMSSIKHNILSKNNKESLLDLVDIMKSRDFISTDNGHYGLLRYLKSSDTENLNFMIWIRSASMLPFKGDNIDSLIYRSDVNERIQKKRLQSMKEKISLAITRANQPTRLKDSYSRAKLSLPCNEMVLGESDLEPSWEPGTRLWHHPIKWAVDQDRLDQNQILSKLWNDESTEIDPVEYLPALNYRTYFVSQKTNNMYLSKIIMDVFAEIKYEIISGTYSTRSQEKILQG